MSRKILVADLLCGAGGSSTGCERALAALGLRMELVCVNHWGVAIETHRRNHPEARHYVQDIAACRPHLIVPEGRLDLLMGSPTCTHHSVARGGKPTSDQQRSDPWHINTWLTELDVKRIIIENVWEFCGWGPVDHKTMRPIPARKGEYFRAWIAALRAIGYELEWRKLNAADYGDATTRQRFILMGRKDRKSIVWPVATHQKKSENLALFPTLKPWRAAREIIDWDIRGKSIFDRKKPLAPKTLARIHAGAVKFNWPEPFLVILRNHMDGKSVDGPVPTIAANGTHIGLAEPIVLKQNFRRDTVSVEQPAPTIMTEARLGLVEPIILSQHNSGAPRSAGEPLPTITTGGAATPDHPGCARPMLVEPFVLSRQGGGAPREVEEPTPTQCAKHSHCLITSYYGASTGAQNTREPLPTVTTKDRFGVVVPVTHAGGFDRARDVEEPLPTIATGNPGGEALAEGIFTPVFDGVHYDILFRMLEPHELAAAMGFDTDETKYEFAGTKTEQIKQIGNAVSVAKMKACVSAIMADAAPKRKSVPQRQAIVRPPRQEAAA